MPQTIIYCIRYEDTFSLYQYFRAGLKLEGGFVDQVMPQTCRAVYNNYDDDIKGQIISSFTSESPLRILCATVAFGMGLECTDVCQVIHVDAP